MNKLKPCPFCGSEASVKIDRTSVWHFWIVVCDGEYGSGCPGYVWKATPVYITEQDAAEAWNRRAGG